MPDHAHPHAHGDHHEHEDHHEHDDHHEHGHHEHGHHPGHGAHEHDQPIRWAGWYDLRSTLRPWARRARRTYLDALDPQPGERVLDVGCGPGSFALACAKRVRPQGTVLGVDAAEEMVRLATAKADRRGLAATFRVERAQDLSLPDHCVDAAACTLALHHVAEADRERAVHHLLRVLRPGGRLLVAEIVPGDQGLLTPRFVRHHAGDRLAPIRALLEQADVELVDVASPAPWLGVLLARAR